jgi:hypothetical protein
MTKPDVVRDQILEHVRLYRAQVHAAWGHALRSKEDPASLAAQVIDAEAALVHFILGFVATPAVDPNEDTQLLETLKEEPKALSLRDSGMQRLFDELLVRHERIYQAIVKYLGGEPKTIQLRTADLLNSVIDLSEIMIAYGGDCADLVRAIREDEAARRANTKRQVRSQENEAKPVMAKTLTAAAAEALGNPTNVLTEPVDRSTPGYPAKFEVNEGVGYVHGHPANFSVVAEGYQTPNSVDESAPPITIPESPQG